MRAWWREGGRESRLRWAPLLYTPYLCSLHLVMSKSFISRSSGERERGTPSSTRRDQEKWIECW